MRCLVFPLTHVVSQRHLGAAGCVLYELLTLRHAFQAKSINALAVKIIAGHYPPPPASYDVAVHELVRGFLQYEPHQRLTAAQALTLPVLQRHVAKYARGLRASCRARLSPACRQLPEPPHCAPPQCGRNEEKANASALSKDMIIEASTEKDAGAQGDVSPPSALSIAIADKEKHQLHSADVRLASNEEKNIEAYAPNKPQDATSPDNNTEPPSTKLLSGNATFTVANAKKPSRWHVAKANFMLSDMGTTLPLSGIHVADGVYLRMEALRVLLEDDLGEDKVRLAHEALERVIISNDLSPRDGLEQVQKQLGDAAPTGYLTLLVQLVHCESYYFVVAGSQQEQPMTVP